MFRREASRALMTALLLASISCAGLPLMPGAATSAPTEEATTAPVAAAVGQGVDALADAPSPTPTETPIPLPTERVITLEVPYSPVSMEVLVRINDWRVSQGLWPLKVNPMLTQIAQAQADYLAGLPDFPEDAHAGPTGEHPKERAADLGWPSYNTPEQMAVDEVAYTGFSPETAITWWQHSPIHAKTLTQTAYREIGVADADLGHGHIYVGVVGSRPNELPVLLDPATGVWYFSSEQYRWAAGDRLQQITRFAFLPDAGAEVGAAAWQSYSSTTSAGDLASAQAVALSDSARTVIRPITLSTDIAWLSSDATITTITVIDKPAPTANETPAPTPSGGDVVPQPTGLPTVAPAEPANANLTLIYGDISLTILHNPPGGRIDISGVVIQSGDQQIRTLDFEGPWLGVPLEDFSVGSCLQTWQQSPNQGDPGIVPGCYIRASVVSLRAPTKFWLTGPFQVLDNGALLRECPAGPAECGVMIPDR